jgi:hypothetical protein
MDITLQSELVSLKAGINEANIELSTVTEIAVHNGVVGSNKSI